MLIQKTFNNGNWGLDRIDQFLLPLDGKFHYNRTGRNSAGQSIDVVIVDSGLEYNNEEFGGRAFPLFDYRTTLSPFHDDHITPFNVRFGVDDYGTGTYMASIIGGKTYGVAKECRLWGVKIYNRPENFKKKYLVDALTYVLSWHLAKSPYIPTVLYLPVVLENEYDFLIDGLLQTLVSNGCIIVVPCGEGNSNVSNVYPANSNYIISVGPTTESDYFLKTYSTEFFYKTLTGNIPHVNYGNVDIYAPGSRIRGAWIKTLDNSRIKTRTKVLSGSYVAGCFVAGYACLFLQDDFSKTQNDFRQFLNDTCTRNIVKGLSSDSKNLFLFNVFQDYMIEIETSGLVGIFEEQTEIEAKINSFIRFSSPQNEKTKITLASGSTLFPNYYLTEDGIIRGKSIALSASLSGYVVAASGFHTGYVDHYFTVVASSRSYSTTKTLWMRILDVNEPPIWKASAGNINNFVAGTSVIYVSAYISANFNNTLFVEDKDNQHDLQFSILYGNLPPGLTLSSNGTLKGTVQNFPVSANEFSAFSQIDRTYQFVLRVFDGYFSTDREFNMTITRTSAHNSPPVFNENTYPDILFNIMQGESINRRLLLTDAEGDRILTRLVPVSAVSFSADVVFGLPSGLSLTVDGFITGSIDVTTSAEKYVFGIEAFDGFTSTIENFAINVNMIDNYILHLTGTIIWKTDFFLGEIYELEKSWFAVSAIATSGFTVVYELVSGFSLPPGLSLDENTGEIHGHVDYVSGNTDYVFRIRAKEANLSAISTVKEFKIRVLDRVSAQVCRFSLMGSFENSYLWSLLHPENVSVPAYKSVHNRYRLNKREFALTFPKPRLHLIEGIRSVADAVLLSALSEDVLSSVKTVDRYWRPIDLHVDDIVYFKARNDRNEVIYETVCLMLIDKFVANNATTVSGKTFVATSAGIQIAPLSLENMRRDLQYDIGFDSQEILPLWLTSDQTGNGDVPGYRAVIPLMYVKPGFGKIITEELKQIQNHFAPRGTVIKFTKLVYEKLTDPNNPQTFIINLPVD